MFGRFFPWPNISVCKKSEHIHSKHNEENNFVLNVLTNESENSISLNFKFPNNTGLTMTVVWQYGQFIKTNF